MLKNLKKNNLKHFLEYLNDSSIELISELCYNVLFNTNLFKKKKDLNKLKKHLGKFKKPLLTLARKSNSIKTKKKLLVNQKGEGLITGLISTILPLITSLITGGK